MITLADLKAASVVYKATMLYWMKVYKDNPTLLDECYQNHSRAVNHKIAVDQDIERLELLCGIGT